MVQRGRSCIPFFGLLLLDEISVVSLMNLHLIRAQNSSPTQVWSWNAKRDGGHESLSLSNMHTQTLSMYQVKDYRGSLRTCIR